jgi:hypothetical protein
MNLRWSNFYLQLTVLLNQKSGRKIMWFLIALTCSFQKSFPKYYSKLPNKYIFHPKACHLLRNVGFVEQSCKITVAPQQILCSTTRPTTSVVGPSLLIWNAYRPFHPEDGDSMDLRNFGILTLHEVTIHKTSAWNVCQFVSQLLISEEHL